MRKVKKKLLEKKIFVLDGPMGTMIQKRKLNEKDLKYIKSYLQEKHKESIESFC